MESAIMEKKFLTHRGTATIKRALRIMGISEYDSRKLSLAEIKKIAKQNYHKLIFEIHPDRGGKGFFYDHTIPCNTVRVTAWDLKKLISCIEGLKFKPMTIDNCNEILEISKGYKTTRDVDFGLNGFI